MYNSDYEDVSPREKRHFGKALLLFASMILVFGFLISPDFPVPSLVDVYVITSFEMEQPFRDLLVVFPMMAMFTYILGITFYIGGKLRF